MVVAKNGDRSQPFLVKKNMRIVIPTEFSYTFMTMLHKRENHPNKTQMLRIFSRAYFMLNVEKVIARVMDSCEYPCKALKHIPKETFQY